MTTYPAGTDRHGNRRWKCQRCGVETVVFYAGRDPVICPNFDCRAAGQMTLVEDTKQKENS